MRQVLNDLTIRSIATELPQLDVWDTKLPCFGVRVTRRGTKTFILKTANRRYSLGRFPYVSLKDARDEARKRIALKYLPAPALPAKTVIESISRPGRRACGRAQSNKPSSACATSRTFRSTKPQPARSSSPSRIWRPRYQNVVYATFKTFLNWCVENDYITAQPARRAHARRTSADRAPASSPTTRCAAFGRNLFKHGEFGALIRSLILSGQRLNQMARFNPAWMRDDLIIFPAMIMKNNLEHTLPLTEEAEPSSYPDCRYSSEATVAPCVNFAAPSPTSRILRCTTFAAISPAPWPNSACRSTLPRRSSPTRAARAIRSSAPMTATIACYQSVLHSNDTRTTCSRSWNKHRRLHTVTLRVPRRSSSVTAWLGSPSLSRDLLSQKEARHVDHLQRAPQTLWHRIF